MNLKKFIMRYGTIIALVLIFAACSIGVQGFFDSNNLINILTQIALLMIIAQGFTMVHIVGEMDLSFANLASLSAVIVAGLLIKGMNPFLAILICLAGGALFGLINGLLVTRLGIPSLITTLAMGIIATGLIYMYTKGVSFYSGMPKSFLYLGRGRIGPIPVLVLIMLAVLLICHIFINKTVAGSHLQATGGNPSAARLAGINTRFYKILGFVLCSLAGTFTGILLTSRLGAANPEGAGGFLMESFAIVLLGQTVSAMGRPSPFGTFIGALIIGIVNNGLTLLGADYYMQDIVKGLIIILAVVISSVQTKRMKA